MQFAFPANRYAALRCLAAGLGRLRVIPPGEECWGRIARMRKVTRPGGIASAPLAPVRGACATNRPQQLPSSRHRAGPKEMYKWADENGVIHYGDSVPAGTLQREQETS